MSRHHKILKRSLDMTIAIMGLLATWPIILLAAGAARLDTGASGFFRQTRIGRHGKPFRITKIRTMKPIEGGTITSAQDARITKLGSILRKFKIDELPQLWNVVIGEMSLVGPRPDMPGYADRLAGEDRVILQLRPGITGPATLKYRDEETLLAGCDDFEKYNNNIIWPDKVKINREYYEHYSFSKDLQYIWKTVLPH